MSDFITISLQFPHHGFDSVRFRLYETAEPGLYRVKRGEAWVTKVGVSVEQGVDIVAREVNTLLGLEEATTPSAIRLGKCVRVRGASMELCEGRGGSGWESPVYRTLSPVFQDVEMGWCVFVGSPRKRDSIFKVQVSRLMPAGVTASTRAEAASNELPDAASSAENMDEVRL